MKRFFLLSAGSGSKQLKQALLSQPYSRVVKGSGQLVHHRKRGVIALFGDFGSEDVPRLQHLQAWLPSALDWASRYTNVAVERAVERLAMKLQDALGEILRSCDWVGVPRGGLVVLGLLSYALNLKHERIQPQRLSREKPLVVVDDCALTGNRFSRFLRDINQTEVIFAHLCSPREVREAIVAEEAQVRACVAPDTLRTVASERSQDVAARWNVGDGSEPVNRRYWLGKVESPIFPWSEPDHNFWNPVTEELEWGWQLAPSEQCLKHKHSPVDRTEVFEIPEPTGLFTLGATVLYLPVAESIYIFDYTTEKQYKLDDVGAALWNAFLVEPTMGAVIRNIVDTYDVPHDRARSDATRLAGQLVDQGLLKHRTTSNTPVPSL